MNFYSTKILLITFVTSLILINQNGLNNKCKINNLLDLSNLFPKTNQEIKIIAEKAMNQILLDINFLENCQNYHTIYAYDQLSKNYAISHTSIKIIEMLYPDLNLQDFAREQLTKLEDFYNKKLSYNKNIYQKLKKAIVSDNLKNTLYDLIKGYELSGINLPEDKLSEIKKNISETNQLEKKFENEATNDSISIDISSEEQKLLKESIRKLIKDGKLELTDTVYSILITNENENIRKKTWYGYSNKAIKNKNRLKNLIKLRHKLAKLLNYNNFAEYEIEDDMAKNSSTVRSFLNKLTVPIQKKFDQEFSKIIENSTNEVTINYGKINPWDIAYIQKKSLKNKLDFKYQEFFELNNTLNKIFRIFENLLDIKINVISNNLFWDSQIIAIELFEKNQSLGFILLDLFSRKNKYNSSFEMTLVPSTKYCKGAAIVVLNLQEKRHNEPYLLTIEDVATIFHEFGHAIHDILGKTELNISAGTKVNKDYLEMPSQVFQELPYISTILKELSYHYKNGQKLTDEQIKTILEFSKYGKGFKYLYQIYYSLIALNIFEHADSDPFKQDAEIFSHTLPKINYYPNYYLNSFVHLIDYNSKYYVYLWSKVFAMDILEKLKNNNFSQEIGKKLKETLLRPGGSEKPEVLLKLFLEREPDINAFLDNFN